jgi:hypothetical protein
MPFKYELFIIMVKESELATLDIDLDADTNTRIIEISLRRGWTKEETVRKLLAAGMMTRAANLVGYDVMARFPNGRVQVMSKARE